MGSCADFIRVLASNTVKNSPLSISGILIFLPDFGGYSILIL